MISGDVIRVGIQWNLIVQCRVDFIVLIVLHEKLQVDCIFLHFTCLTTWAIWRVLTELICRNILLLIGTISYAKRTNWARSESMWEEESKIDKHKVIAWLIKISYLRYLNAMRPPTAAEKNETTVKRVMLGINTYKLARRRIIRRKLYMHFIDFLSSFQLTNKQQNEVIRRLWRQSNKYSIIFILFFCGMPFITWTIELTHGAVLCDNFFIAAGAPWTKIARCYSIGLEIWTIFRLTKFYMIVSVY